LELTRETTGDTTVIVFQMQYLDLSNADALIADIASLLQGDHKVLFDMNRVEFVDSAGLGALMACRRRLLADGAELTLCGLSKKVRSVFEVARMHRLFVIAETREEALTPSEPA
jgi:anti-sigma B factor antagonist